MVRDLLATILEICFKYDGFENLHWIRNDP
jgi:hypothetical protein